LHQGRLVVFYRGQLHVHKAVYLGLIALFVAPLGGCGYVTAMTFGDATPQYDASTGADFAIIADSDRRRLDPACRIVQDNNLYREVTVDAGAILLQVECSRISGVFGERVERLGRANLDFYAEPGRRYQVEFRDEFGFPHVAVTVAGAESPVIQRSLVDTRLPAAGGAPHVTLVSRSGPGIIPCTFGRPWTENRASSVRRPAVSFADEPYSHQIVAECSTYAWVTGDVEERYEAPIAFVPESGRLYTVHMDEEDPNFVFVTDVSADVRTVAYVRATKTL
jgi:hypothetical protein